MLGKDYIRCLVNIIFTFCLTVIGRLLFRYKGTYPEYYTPEADLPKAYFSTVSKKDL